MTYSSKRNLEPVVLFDFLRVTAWPRGLRCAASFRQKVDRRFYNVSCNPMRGYSQVLRSHESRHEIRTLSSVLLPCVMFDVLHSYTTASQNQGEDLHPSTDQNLLEVR